MLTKRKSNSPDAEAQDSPRKTGRNEKGTRNSAAEILMADIMHDFSKRLPNPIKVNSSTPPPQKVGNFQLVASNVFSDNYPVHVFLSVRTGMVVVIGEARGSSVTTYVSFPTETQDDDGLPDAVRYLVFLGSEDYPYRSTVTISAPNCLVTNTSSWSTVTHTCYTYTSITEGGFFSMLPIYIDHLFYPTLKKTNYITDVYHIDESGQDGGTFFQDLEALQYSKDDIIKGHLMKTMYEGTNYKFSPHGHLQNLRNRTTNEKVRTFHQKYYRPENCFVIVAGSNAATVLSFMEKIERKIISKGPKGSFYRPWQSEIPPLRNEDTLVTSITYPDIDVAHGQVVMAWRGPKITKDYPKILACDLMLKYLTESPESPVVKLFLRSNPPLASKITYEVEMFSESFVSITFHEVPINKMEIIKDEMNSVIKACVQSPEYFTPEKMSNTFRLKKSETVKNLESNSHLFFAQIIINYQIYGKNVEDFERRVKYLTEVDHIEKLPPKFWSTLLWYYFFKKKGFCVLAYPNAEQIRKLDKEKAQKINDRLKKYGKDGLNQFKKLLEKASLDNKQSVPRQLLENLYTNKKPINYYQFNIYGSEGNSHSKFNLEKVPICMQITDIFTNYVTIYCIIDIEKLGADVRPYLPLLLECMLRSPVLRNGIPLPYAEVVNERNEDLISLTYGIGIESNEIFTCGLPSQLVYFSVKVDVSKYLKGITWLKETIFNVAFDEDCYAVVLGDLIQKSAENLENRTKMVAQIMNAITHDRGSTYHATNPYYQNKFLMSMEEDLFSNYPNIHRRLQTAKDLLISEGLFRLHMIANLEHLTNTYFDAASYWQIFLPGDFVVNKYLPKIKPDHAFLRPKIADSCAVFEGFEGYVCICSPSCNDFNDKDLPALIVCSEYLSLSEGPLNKSMKDDFGGELKFIPCPEHGKLYLIMSNLNNTAEALKKCYSFISQTRNLTFWDENLLNMSINGVLSRLITPENDVQKKALESIYSYCLNRPPDYKKKLIDKILLIMAKDMVLVADKHLSSMFNFYYSRISISCPQYEQYNNVAYLFDQWGVSLKAYNNYGECFKNLL